MEWHWENQQLREKPSMITTSPVGLLHFFDPPEYKFKWSGHSPSAGATPNCDSLSHRKSSNREKNACQCDILTIKFVHLDCPTSQSRQAQTIIIIQKPPQPKQRRTQPNLWMDGQSTNLMP